MKENNYINLECECQGEILRVEFFEDEINESFNFSMFNFGYGNPTWKYRLKLIWHIITTGQPYTDQVIINRKKANKLADFIKEKIG